MKTENAEPISKIPFEVPFVLSLLVALIDKALRHFYLDSKDIEVSEKDIENWLTSREPG